jgi:hypothetical protein
MNATEPWGDNPLDEGRVSVGELVTEHGAEVVDHQRDGREVHLLGHRSEGGHLTGPVGLGHALAAEMTVTPESRGCTGEMIYSGPAP